MGLPFVLDVAIGLIFIFLILSLLASEIQELITTILQWRAKHLRESIEVLLGGGANSIEKEDSKTANIKRNNLQKLVQKKAKELTNQDVSDLTSRIYNDPLLKSVNQEAKGLLAQAFRALTYRIPGYNRTVFGEGHTTGPSYIPAETFATSLMERLGIPTLTKKLTEIRLQKFANRVIGDYAYDDNGRIKILNSQFLKTNWQKGNIRVVSESLKLDENRTISDLMNFDQDEDFRALVEEYDDVLRDFEAGQTTLETCVERMGESLSGYIENLNLKYKISGTPALPPPAIAANPTSSNERPPDERSAASMTFTEGDFGMVSALSPTGEYSIEGEASPEVTVEATNRQTNPDTQISDEQRKIILRFIKRLESFKIGIFGRDNERAILSGGLRPSIFEIAQLVNQTSSVYKEVADGFQQLTIKSKPIRTKVNPEIQRRLLDEQIEVVEKNLERDYFLLIEKQISENLLEALKSQLIQRGYLNDAILQEQLKEFPELIEEQLGIYNLSQFEKYQQKQIATNPGLAIRLSDIQDPLAVRQIIANILAALNRDQRQRVFSAALSQRTDQERRQAIEATLQALNVNQRQLIACQPIVVNLFKRLSDEQRLFVVRTAWETLKENPARRQRVIEATWNHLKPDQRQQIIETVLEVASPAEYQRLVKASWAEIAVEYGWDSLSPIRRQQVAEAALRRSRMPRELTAAERRKLTAGVPFAALEPELQQEIGFDQQAITNALVGEGNVRINPRLVIVSNILSKLTDEQRQGMILDLTIEDFRNQLAPEDAQLVDFNKTGVRQLIINDVWGTRSSEQKALSATVSEPPPSGTPIDAPLSVMEAEQPAFTAEDTALTEAPQPPMMEGTETLSMSETTNRLSEELQAPEPLSSETSSAPEEGWPVSEPLNPEPASWQETLPPEPFESELPSSPDAELSSETSSPTLSEDDRDLLVNAYWESIAASSLPSVALQLIDKTIVSTALALYNLSHEDVQRIIEAARAELTAEERQMIRADGQGLQPKTSSQQIQLLVAKAWPQLSPPERRSLLETAWRSLNDTWRQLLVRNALRSAEDPPIDERLGDERLTDQRRRLAVNLAWEELDDLRKGIIFDTYLRRLSADQQQMVLDNILNSLTLEDRYVLIGRAIDRLQLTDEERRIFENAQTYKDIEAVLSKLPKPVRESLESLARRSQTRVQQTGNELSQLRDEIGLWFDRSMSRATGVYKRNAKGVAIAIGITIAIITNADALYMINRLSSDEELRRVVSDQAARVVSQTDSTQFETDLARVKEQTDAVLQDLALPIGWNFVNLRGQLRCTSPAIQTKPSDPAWQAFVRECLSEEPPASETFHLGRFGTALRQHLLTLLLIPIGWAVSGFAIAMGAPFWFDILGKIVNVRNSGSRPASATTQANPGTSDTLPNQEVIISKQAR